MKPLTLSKTFPYLMNFPSTSSNLVTCLVLYKEDQATHQRVSFSLIPLSAPNTLKLHFAAYISKLFHTSPFPLQKYLFLEHTITHYPSLILKILKLHHFATQKQISISFFISHTKSPFLESNITHDITQKTTPAASLISCIHYIQPSYYLSHISIYFINTFLKKYPYILLIYL